MNPVIQRRQTRHFIREDPIVVSLIRTPIVVTPAAGTKPGVPENLPPQVFRLIPNMGDPAKTRLNRIEQGPIVKEDYILVGSWDADITLLDEFDWGGHRYRITTLVERGNDGLLAGVSRFDPV